MMTNTDMIEVIENLRGVGFDDDRIFEMLRATVNGDLSLSEIADIVECAEEGDDDALFELMVTLGVA